MEIVGVGAFANVTRLIMSDMNLEDGCGIVHLVTLPQLKDLNLDGNRFTRAPEGLGRLKTVETLFMDRLTRWGGSDEMDLFGEELCGMQRLCELRFAGSVCLPAEQSGKESGDDSGSISGATPWRGSTAGSSSATTNASPCETNAGSPDSISSRKRSRTSDIDKTER